MACCTVQGIAFYQPSINDISLSRQHMHVHVRHRLAGDLAVLHAELAPGRPRVRRLDDGGDAARREHEVVELVGQTSAGRRGVREKARRLRLV